MIIDHVGIAINNSTCRIIGRLAFPLFAFQMAIGMKHTKNIQRHTTKLLIFATICQIPYIVFMKMCKIDPDLNIIFTFTVSNLLVLVLDYFKVFNKKDDNKKEINWRNLLIILLLTTLILVLANYIDVDYGIYGVLLPVFFYYAFENRILIACVYPFMIIAHYLCNPSTITLLGIVGTFDLLFILNYNGKKNYKNGKVFYWIYFLHLIVLIAFKYWLLSK